MLIKEQKADNTTNDNKSALNIFSKPHKLPNETITIYSKNRIKKCTFFKCKSYRLRAITPPDCEE